MEYSLSRSLCLSRLIVHHGNEQISDAGRAQVAKGGELVTIDSIEKHNAVPDSLALVHRLERPRRADPLGMDHYLQIARLEFLHAAIEYNTSAVDEHHIGEHVLNLFHLVRRHHDGAAAIEIVVQQRIVELLAIKD